VVAIVVFLGAVALALGVWIFRWQRDRAYVGTTRPAVLNWTCGNGIFWRDESRDVSWWAGHDPMATGRLSATVDTSGTFPVPKQAVGKIHFASYRTAVFTSETGARITLYRQSKHAMYQADCSGTGQPAS